MKKRPSASKYNQDNVIDIAIVGGGVSGVYTSWRLMTAGSGPVLSSILRKRSANQLRTVVFEMSDRIGGRLDTLFLPGMPHLAAEVGGMRYLSNQAIVYYLVKAMGLTQIPFPMGDKNNLFYLRGHRFREGAFGNPKNFPDLVPYFLPDKERMSPDDLINYAIEQVVPNSKGWDRRKWEEAMKTFVYRKPPYEGGVPIYDIGFWNLIYSVVGHEGWSLMIDGGGYDSNLINWNSAAAMQNVMEDFSSNPDYYKVKEGYMQVPLRLAKAFERAGGEVQLHQKLLGFDRDPVRPYLFELKFQDMNSGKTKVMYTSYLVLAMPPRSLQLISPSLGKPAEPNFFFGDPWVRENLNSVFIQPAFKLFLGFHEPWWREDPWRLTHGGESVTDMALRNTYYFGTESDYEPNNSNSLLMAAYADEWAVGFWKVLESQEVYEGQHPSLPAREIRPRSGYEAPKPLVEMAYMQLKDVYNIDGAAAKIPKPYIAAWKDWSEDPYGGGYHEWKARYKFWDVIPRMIKPIPNANVYVCGEAFSDGQGWAEGALRTAEVMLEKHFRLSRPSWLPKDYYLGPGDPTFPSGRGAKSESTAVRSSRKKKR